MTKTDARDAVMTTTEVAAMLGVTTGRVRAMHRAGLLDGQTRGGVTLYLRAEVERLVWDRGHRGRGGERH